MRQEIKTLIHQAVAEANRGNRQQAQFIFSKVLELEPQNETALLWLALLTANPFEAVELLEGLLKRNPANKKIQTYLNQAQARCKELETQLNQNQNNRAGSPGSFQLQPSRNAYDYRDIPPSNRPVPYLGEFLMKEGVINQHQLNVALRTHYDMALRGQPKRVGEVMIQLGYLTSQQLERTLMQQRSAYN
jgi:tetratricopeptide (TPR) repeat protein